MPIYNVMAIIPDTTPLPLPEPWHIYDTRWWGLQQSLHYVIRAPLGTPLPEGARVLERRIVSGVETHRPSSTIRSYLTLTPAETRGVQLQCQWYRDYARVITKASVRPSEWLERNPKPFPHMANVLDALAEGLYGERLPTSREVSEVNVLSSAGTTDPYVTPHHLSAQQERVVATTLPGSPLSIVLVREPAPTAPHHFTVALGIGGLMRHLRGGYDTYEEAREAGLRDLHEVRRAAVQRMVIEGRGPDRWHLWGIDWRRHLKTITVVRAAHKQNGYDALHDASRVETVADPTLAGLVDTAPTPV